ncbi:hypothetical protein D3C85_1225600 [compost metagenome]
MFGWDKPLTLGQRDISPAGHACLTNACTVAEHYQGQHGVVRCAVEALGQQSDNLRYLHTTQARRLGHDLGGGEIGKLDPGHGIGRDQVQLMGLAEGHGQQTK